VVTVVEFRQIHSLFLAILAPQFAHPAPIPEGVQKIIRDEDASASSQPVPEDALAWLDLVGAAIRPHRLRLYGQQNAIAEAAGRALLRFWAFRKGTAAEDIYKVDWFATHFFMAREEESKQPTGWVKTKLQLLLQGIPFPPLSSDTQSFLGELPPLLDDVRFMGTFHQFTDTRLLERGRELKVQLREDFCNPVALGRGQLQLGPGKKVRRIAGESDHRDS